MTDKTPAEEIAILDETTIAAKIYEVRGQRVMLDFDLAEIYGYTTKRFNEQVSRNAEKFEGEDFMFQLLQEEWEILRSQNATSSWGGSRYLPHAFTEQGVYMLMTVLRGELATLQSRALVRIFKRMKDHIIANQDLIGQHEFLMLSIQVSQNAREIYDLRTDLHEVDGRLCDVMESLGDMVSQSELSETMYSFRQPSPRRNYFLLDGDPVEAELAYREIYGSARRSIYVIDNYIGEKTLDLLSSARIGVSITIFSDDKGRGLPAGALDRFREEHPGAAIDLRPAGGIFHDRYILLDFGEDTETLYHCGASSKDAGTHVTTITRIPEPTALHDLIHDLK